MGPDPRRIGSSSRCSASRSSSSWRSTASPVATNRSSSARSPHPRPAPRSPRSTGSTARSSGSTCSWLRQAVTGDLGTSLASKQPVLDEFIRRAPVTIELTVLATIISLVAGTSLGMASALNADRRPVASGSRLLSGLGLSVPDFVVGSLLVYVFSANSLFFTVGGYVPFLEDPIGNIKAMTLPAITLGIFGTALVAADDARRRARRDDGTVHHRCRGAWRPATAHRRPPRPAQQLSAGGDRDGDLRRLPAQRRRHRRAAVHASRLRGLRADRRVQPRLRRGPGRGAHRRGGVHRRQHRGGRRPRRDRPAHQT